MSLTSTNPDIGFVIGKHPGTPMVCKKIRNGVSYGFYDDSKQRYIVYFEDGGKQPSYTERGEQYDHMNYLKYTSPVMYLNMLSEYFSANKLHEKDIECDNKIVIYSIKLESYSHNVIGKLKAYLPDVVFEITNVIGVTYNLTISTNNTIYHLLNIANVICAIAAILNSDDYYVTDDFIVKIVKSINVLNAPYFVRYLFSSRAIPNAKIFDKVRTDIQKTPEGNCIMYYGNTALQRRSYIRGKLEGFNNNIIDIGCGEGFYAVPFANRLKTKGKTYYAHDIDREELDKLEKKKIDNNIQNLNIIDNIDVLIGMIDMSGETKYDIIITEVIEHMGIEDAKKLIAKALTIPYNTIIITTPNRDFNKYYIMETEFRHHDHKYELDAKEFQIFADSIFDGREYNIVGIGDTIDRVSVTQGIVIET